MSRKQDTIDRSIYGDVARRVSQNSTWLLLARISGQALMFLLAVVAARGLGEDGLGQYAFISAVLLVGNVLSTYGLDTLLIREISTRGNADIPLMAAAVCLQLMISALLILLIGLGGGRLPNQTAETIVALRLATLSLIPLALSTVYSAALRAYEHMELYLLFSLISNGTQVAIGLALLSRGVGLAGLAWAMLLGQLAGALGAAGLCWKVLPGFRHSWRISGAILQRTAIMGWRLAALMVLAVLYQRLSIFTLSLLGDDATTGWFSAAARIVEAAKMVPYAVFGALFPAMARRGARPELVRLAATGASEQRVLRYLLLYASGCGLLLALLADWLIPWLYGADYGPAVGALRILVWSLVPFVISLRLSFELVSQRRDGLALGAAWLATGLMLLLCVYFVPAWGLTGACWAVLSGETIQAVILLASWRVARSDGSTLMAESIYSRKEEG